MATKLVDRKVDEEEENLRKENNRRTDEALEKVVAQREKSKERGDDEVQRRKSALESIHRMEWLKNKHDLDVLQQRRRMRNSGSLIPVQKKAEGDYFSGTGKGAKIRERKDKRIETIKSLINLSTTADLPPPPPRNAPPPPPPVNAWAVKPGSALFPGTTAATRLTYGIKNYDEAEMIRQAVKESLQEAEDNFINLGDYGDVSYANALSSDFGSKGSDRFPRDNKSPHEQSNGPDKSDIGVQINKLSLEEKRCLKSTDKEVKVHSEEKVFNGTRDIEEEEMDYYEKGRLLAQGRAKARERNRLAAAKEEAEVSPKPIEPERLPTMPRSSGKSLRFSPDKPEDDSKDADMSSQIRHVKIAPEPQLPAASSWEAQKTAEISPVIPEEQRKTWLPKDNTEDTGAAKNSEVTIGRNIEVSLNDLLPDSIALPPTQTGEDNPPVVTEATSERRPFSPEDYIVMEKDVAPANPAPPMDLLGSYQVPSPYPYFPYPYAVVNYPVAIPDGSNPQYTYPGVPAAPYPQHYPFNLAGGQGQFTPPVQPDHCFQRKELGTQASSESAPTQPDPTSSFPPAYTAGMNAAIPDGNTPQYNYLAAGVPAAPYPQFYPSNPDGGQGNFTPPLQPSPPKEHDTQASGGSAAAPTQPYPTSSLPPAYPAGNYPAMNAAIQDGNTPQYNYSGTGILAAPYYPSNLAGVHGDFTPTDQPTQAKGHDTQASGGSAPVTGSAQPDCSSSLQQALRGLPLSDAGNVGLLQMTVLLNQYVLSQFGGNFSSGNMNLGDIAAMIPQLPTVPQTPQDDFSKPAPPLPDPVKLPLTNVQNLAMPSFQSPTSLPGSPGFSFGSSMESAYYAQASIQAPPSVHNFVRAPFGRGRGAVNIPT